MDALVEWQIGPAQFYTCVTTARSWEDLTPALVASWVRFAEVLGTHVPEDVRNEINLSFFASGGRVTFGHGTRDYPVADARWDAVPTAYTWTVMCKCPWVEEQWYDAGEATDVRSAGLLAEVGITFARACLAAAGNPRVAEAFRRHGLGNLPVRGQGVTQSPAKFETDLDSLFRGDVPELRP